MNEIKSQIKEYIVDNFMFGDNRIRFSDTDSFINKGILDSTGVLEIITFLEEKFEITIEDDEILPQNLDSVENIFHFLNKKLDQT
jgi:acyl carrier protein